MLGERAGGLVLLVEDNADTRDVLARVLHMRGYETATADDGLDALAYLRSGGHASVIILDLLMPNMDGWTFQRALKADPRWADIPVIIYSALPPDDPGDAIGVLRKGSTNPDVLLDLVARASTRPGRRGTDAVAPPGHTSL
jgi:CheY-like chemotaxis protein